jgi:3-dehydroquinate dehydratase-2
MKKAAKKLHVCVIHGPNLNVLERREPGPYPKMSLDDIHQLTLKLLASHSVEMDWFQSNSEGSIIEKIHDLSDEHSKTQVLVINPGAYSHTSVAILDALKILTIPIIEVHMSNVYQREDFRQTLLTAKAARMIMSGAGEHGIFLAIYSEILKKG